MPEARLLEGVGLAVLAAGLVFLVFVGRFTGPIERRWSAFGEALGTGVGFSGGAWLLGLQPRWPPVEDRDRFLGILLPLAVAIECLAALPHFHRWAAWILRLVLAAVAAPTLLHGTTYLTDLAGPGSREWSGQQTTLWLGGMAAALTAVWILAAREIEAYPGRAMALVFAVTCAVAGLTSMLSGYLGGELGLALGGAVGGIAITEIALRGSRSRAAPASSRPASQGFLGPAVVGLFAVLVVGHFFGQLLTLHAAILLAAPLLAAVPGLLPRIGHRPAFRIALGVVLVAIPLAIVLFQAGHQFVQDSEAISTPGEATDDDYSQYR